MKQGSLPITIGITGHRDIRDEDIPSLRDSVTKILKEISTKCPSSPLIVLSALAEGADRVAAHTALETGARLVVPIPFRRDLYERDFTSEASKQEFASLLDRSERWFELPLLGSVREEDILEYGPMRDRQYAYIGAYIARYSHFIIALWDGDPHEKVGGTSYVVNFKRRGIPPPFVTTQGRFEPEETGFVYHILAPRKNQTLPKGTPGSITVLSPLETEKQNVSDDKFDSILADTDLFNSDEIRLLPSLGELHAQSKQYLSPELPESLSDERTSNLAEYFSIADTLAIYFQKRTLRSLRVLFSTVMCATVIFGFYSNVDLGHPFELVVLFAIFLVAYVIFYFAARKKYQDKFQDYRALAEGLRIQYYWKLAGIDESVANNYLKEQRSELDWIRHGLRSWSLPLYKTGKPLLDLPPEENKRRWGIIVNGWVMDQYKYFAKSSLREVARLKKINKVANIFLGTGFLLIALNMVYQYFIGYRHLPVLLFMSSVLPVGAGLLFGYAEKRSLSAHARQYERMAALFSKAKRHLDESIEAGNFDEARNIIYELGREALKENGEWVLTHRERPIEIPLA